MKICSNFQFNANLGAIFLDNPYLTLKSADLPFTAPLCAIYHWKGNFLRCLEPFLVYLLGSNFVHASKITKKEKKWSTIKNVGKQYKLTFFRLFFTITQGKKYFFKKGPNSSVSGHQKLSFDTLILSVH